MSVSRSTVPSSVGPASFSPQTAAPRSRIGPTIRVGRSASVESNKARSIQERRRSHSLPAAASPSRWGSLITNTGGNINSVVKTGAGKTILSGANTYTGTTTISAGILSVNGSLGSSSAVTVKDGGTLGGSGTVSGSVTVESGGKVGPGNSPGVLTTGAITYETGSIFAWDLVSNLDQDADTPTDETTGVRGTDYDGLTASSLTVQSDAIFRVVLGGAADLANGFWTKTQKWDGIFSVSGATTYAAEGMLFNKFEVYKRGNRISRVPRHRLTVASVSQEPRSPGRPFRSRPARWSGC